MHRITLALLLLFSVSTVAQQGINYKAVIKDGAGAILANDLIVVQFIILDGAAAIYEETHTPTTDANGIIILNIGEGAPVSGDFSTLDWSSNNHFLNVQINTGGGLQDMGTTAFKTVPYALHAKTAVSVTGNSGTTNFLSKSIDGQSLGDSRIFDDGTNIGIGTTNPLSELDLRANAIGFRQQFNDVSPSIGFYTDSGGAFLQTHNNFPLLFATGNGSTQMTLSTAGNLGIGTNPTAKLDIAGNIKITDGTEGAGKVLTSDADGLAFWDDSVISLISALEARIAALEPAVIGDIREGGVVFWVDPTDDTHGLVCALSDYGTTVMWGCYGTDLPSVPNVTSGPNGPGAEIGDGITNTNGILTDCPTAPAALAARSYGPDWFLPSAKELKEMFVNQATLEAVPGFVPFVNNYYWSSTEFDSLVAYLHNVNWSSPLTNHKSVSNFVRAVRAF